VIELEEALTFFLRTDMDISVMESVMIEKRSGG
jgi:hypothetical protein